MYIDSTQNVVKINNLTLTASLSLLDGNILNLKHLPITHYLSHLIALFEKMRLGNLNF